MSSSGERASLSFAPPALVRVPLPCTSSSTNTDTFLSALRRYGLETALLRNHGYVWPPGEQVFPTRTGARIWSEFALSRAALELERTAWRSGRRLDVILVEGWEVASLPVEGPVEDVDGWVEDVSRRRSATARGGILGAVLAGGPSQRMGRSKPELPVLPGHPESGAWVERTWLQLRRICGRVAVVARQGQEFVLPLRAELETLGEAPRVVADLRQGAGPLAALETALAHAETSGDEAVLMLPTDLPYLDLATLDRLRRAWCERDRRSAGVAFAREGPSEDEGLDPAVLVLGVPVLADVRSLLDAGQRRLATILEVAKISGLPRPVVVAESGSALEIGPLENCNRPEDWVRYAAQFPTGHGPVCQERR